MHLLRAALTTTAVASALTFGGAAWAATAFTSPTVIPTAAVTTIAPVEKATPPAPAAHATCEYGNDTAVEAIAWSEIARLESLGFPVCETIWSWDTTLDDGAWGLAYSSISETDGRTLIVLESDANVYAGYNLTEAVRSTVRHEYGHIIAYRAGDLTIDADHEAAADAVAQALTPDNESRVWFYDEDVDTAELTTAQAAVATATAQTL